jgi:hypothetical protein
VGAALLLLVLGVPTAAPTEPVHSTWNTASAITPATGCSPGPFCGGGHSNLTAPYVPYPATPSMAPDGLAYGPIGTEGARGTIGAATFTKGSATIRGVSPAGSTGANTVINANTYWGNETISLLGNVTIDAGFALNVWNSVLTFTETATSVHWAYGFNLSKGGFSSLYLQHGSNVTQTSASANSWFLYTPGLAYRADVENSTLNVPSGTAPSFGVPSGYTFATHLWTASTMFSRGIFVSEFNDSTYNGYGNFEYATSLNVTDHAQHSLLESGWYVGPDSGNDSFHHVVVGINSGRIDQQGSDAHAGVFSLNDSSIFNLVSPTFLYVPTAPGLDIQSVRNVQWYGAGRLYLVGSLIENWTLWSGLGSELGGEAIALTNALGVTAGIFGGNYSGQSMVVENSTIENVLFATTGYDSLFSVLTSGEVLNADGNLVTIEHDRVFNVTAAAATATDPLVFYGTSSANENAEFNVFQKFSTPKIPNSDFQVLGVHALDYNVSYNLFLNWGTAQQPAASDTVDWIDDSQSLYNSLVGEVNLSRIYYPTQCFSGVPYACLPTGPFNLAAHTWRMVGNFAENVSGQSWIAQVVGIGGYVADNVQVNLTEGTGIGVSVASGSAFATLVGNTCYGVYNSSFCVGSNQGGAISTTYSGNSAYDVDNSSYGLWSSVSNDTFQNETGQSLLVFNNANVTDVNRDSGFWGYPFSRVQLDYSALAQVSLLGQISNAAETTQRAPFANDFYITELNSYLPGPFLNQACTLGQASSNANPSILNFTGYLGLYLGQWSCVKTTEVKGESSLAVWGQGDLSPSVVIAGGGIAHDYSVDIESPIETSIAADSPTAPSATVEFYGGESYAGYAITAASSSGSTPLVFQVTASAAGVASVTFNPATMPLNETFTAQCTSYCSGGGSAPTVGTNFLGLPIVLWIGLGALGVAIAVGVEVGRHRA